MGAFKRMFITRGTKLHWITLVFSGIMLSFVIFEHSRLLGGTPSIQQSPRITLDNTNNIRKSHLETEEEEEFSRLRGNPDFEEYLDSAGFTVQHFKVWKMISISIQVITQNRPASLKRLCESLVKARYAGDTNVQLTFHIESDADEITKHFIQNEFKWTHGPLQVRQRVQKGGLLAAITESWYPLTNDEYAIILEDDIEVGPLFYLWSKLSLIKYRYLPHANSQDPLDSMISTQLFGISLYTPRVQELTIPRRKIDPYSRLKQRAFLWQLPCSWGAVYFPDKWREFIGYIRARLQNTTSYPAESLLPPTISQTYPDFPHGNYEVYLPNSRSNAWKKSWKRYFIEMISLRAYVMVYPNYWNQTSFSTNWLEPGTHISPNSKVRKRIDEFRVPLIKSGYVSTSGLDVSDEQLVWFSFDSFQKLSELPVMDPFFNLTSFEGLQRGIDSVVIHPIVNQ